MHVERAGGGDGGLHRPLRDLVEDDAADAPARQPGGDRDMPGDRLALAVGVGRQEDGIGLADRLAERGDRLPLLGADLVGRREVVAGVDPQGAAGQIADVAERGAHDVARAEVFADRLGLGW